MLTRMMVMVDRDAEPQERFALVLQSYPNLVGAPNAAPTTIFEAKDICRHDNYALCDYWATMYNIGKADIEQCKESLAKGYDGVPKGEEARKEFIEARYGTSDVQPPSGETT